jgi:slit protein 2
MYRLLFHNHNMLLIVNLLIILTLTAINGDPFGGHHYYGYPNSHLSINGGDSISLKCPRLCTCVAQTVDCSHRGLTQVPRKIPLETERL